MKEIVLVEDSDADAALLRRALDYFSISNPLRRFVTGGEALAYLNSVAQAAAIVEAPAVFFIDLVLPGMSGFQILEDISRQPAFAKSLRIVLTNLSEKETFKRAYSLGAQSFLIKPVQSVDVKELIEAFPGYWSFNLQPFAQVRRGLRVPSK